MSLNRFAKKVDSTQADIVAALRKAGWYVYILSKPVDLLCYKPSKGFRLLEIKSKRKKDGTTARRKAQVEQNEFIDVTGCPVVVTPEDAINALEVK